MNKKIIGIIMCSAGVVMFIAGLILFSVSLGMKIPGITVTIYNFFSILFGSTFLYGALEIFTTIVLIFGFFSILFGSTFLFVDYLEAWNLFFSLLYILTGLSYLISGIFIFKLSNRARKLGIFISIGIVLIHVMSFLCFIFYFDYYGWGRFMLLKFSPYLITPLFFVIFLTRPKIKEKFKK